MNKKVLFISYFFPPLGGGGVLRVTKFVKYLGDFGWKPVVITVKKGFYPITDEGLLSEIPRQVKTIRVKYPELGFWFKAKAWQSFLRYFLYPLVLFPDNQALWILPAVLAGYKLIKKEKIKIIFSSSASYSDHLVALILKKLTGVKWVADFRDVWKPSGWQKNLVGLIEISILKNADLVSTVSPGLTKIYQKFAKEKPTKFTTITNGYDEEDFIKIQNLTRRQAGAKFKVIHAGALYGSRQADLFFQALKELNIKDIELELVGTQKRFSHKESIRKLMSADVLLLILSPTDGPAVLTGKIFEYLRSRIPILAIAPKNFGAANLINQLKIGEVAEPNNLSEIKQKIKKMNQKWFKNELKIPQIEIERFERKNLTEILAKNFDNLLNFSSKKIRLCLVGNIRSPQNQNLVEYFKKRNYEIHFISTTNAKISGIKIYFLGEPIANPWYFLRSLNRIQKLVKKIKPDLINGQDLVFGGIWAYLTGLKPLVTSVWGTDVFGYNRFPGYEKYLVRKTLQKSDRVYGPSMALKAQAVKIGLDPRKFQLIHFGVDLNIFRPQNVAFLKVKHRVKDEKIIFCPRTIAPIYNTDIVIETLARFKNAKIKLFLIAAGAEPNYLLAVEKLIIKYNLVDKVVFLPRLSAHEMADYYNLAEVVISLASSDGCASSFLEALSCQRKIIITDLPFTHEWQDAFFWSAPVRDSQKTYLTVKKALKYSKTKFKKSGRQNRELIGERAELNANFEKLDQLYQELIN